MGKLKFFLSVIFIILLIYFVSSNSSNQLENSDPSFDFTNLHTKEIVRIFPLEESFILINQDGSIKSSFPLMFWRKEIKFDKSVEGHHYYLSYSHRFLNKFFLVSFKFNPSRLFKVIDVIINDNDSTLSGSVYAAKFFKVFEHNKCFPNLKKDEINSVFFSNYSKSEIYGDGFIEIVNTTENVQFGCDKIYVQWSDNEFRFFCDDLLVNELSFYSEQIQTFNDKIVYFYRTHSPAFKNIQLTVLKENYPGSLPDFPYIFEFNYNSEQIRLEGNFYMKVDRVGWFSRGKKVPFM
jgi:hypothetical protein